LKPSIGDLGPQKSKATRSDSIAPERRPAKAGYSPKFVFSVTGPLALGRHVVVGDFEGYVHLLSREDGSFAARIRTDSSGILAPAIALDATSFLVQTRSGGVYAFAIQ